jgi:type I restriction enzyme M protein
MLRADTRRSLILFLGIRKKTDYYSQKNGTYIEDTIGTNGTDWTFAQHKKVDLVPTEEDFRKTVSDYLAWRVGTILKGEQND